ELRDARRRVYRADGRSARGGAARLLVLVGTASGVRVVAYIDALDGDPDHRHPLVRTHILVVKESAVVGDREIIVRHLVVGVRHRGCRGGVVDPVHAFPAYCQGALGDVGRRVGRAVGRVVVVAGV